MNSGITCQQTSQVIPMKFKADLVESRHTESYLTKHEEEQFDSKPFRICGVILFVTKHLYPK
jgi:hypothetical protein